MRIPFNKPFIVGKELHYISQAVLAGQLAGDGEFTRRCHEWLEERTGTCRALLTHSCTAALEMAAILCDVGPGDEVILPSFTFVSTANAFALRGATPVFAEIRRDTLNLDERRLEELITDRTRVIVPVHYAGIGCDMDEVLRVARRHSLRVVEDAAQGVDASWMGRPLGTLGDLGTFSFHETKNFISGEGGALLVNDPELVDRAERIRQKGTNRDQFLRGEVDKYTWVDIGSSFLPSEIIAAFLYAQLESAEVITQARHEIFDRYLQWLQPLADDGLLRLPTIPEGCKHNAHMFYVIVNSPDERAGLLAHLLGKGILAVFHYVPLHLSPMGEKLGYEPGALPVTEDLAERLVRLPCFFELTEAEQREVVDAVFGFFARP